MSPKPSPSVPLLSQTASLFCRPEAPKAEGKQVSGMCSWVFLECSFYRSNPLVNLSIFSLVLEEVKGCWTNKVKSHKHECSSEVQTAARVRPLNLNSMQPVRLDLGRVSAAPRGNRQHTFERNLAHCSPAPSCTPGNKTADSVLRITPTLKRLLWSKSCL